MSYKTIPLTPETSAKLYEELARVERLHKEAARYRWIRDTPPIEWPAPLFADASLSEDDFDRLIDEEIARE